MNNIYANSFSETNNLGGNHSNTVELTTDMDDMPAGREETNLNKIDGMVELGASKTETATLYKTAHKVEIQTAKGGPTTNLNKTTDIVELNKATDVQMDLNKHHAMVELKSAMVENDLNKLANTGEMLNVRVDTKSLNNKAADMVDMPTVKEEPRDLNKIEGIGDMP